MTDIHVRALDPDREPALCQWTHMFSGVRLECEDTAIPGGIYCAECLITDVHRPGWQPSISTVDLIAARREAS